MSNTDDYQAKIAEIHKRKTAVYGELQCFVKYTLYDGPDALIANKLLEMGISINPGNVDWYKRSLLQAQA